MVGREGGRKRGRERWRGRERGRECVCVYVLASFGRGCHDVALTVADDDDRPAPDWEAVAAKKPEPDGLVDAAGAEAGGFATASLPALPQPT